MLELPRITRSLRIFTTFGRKSVAELEPNDLFRKQREQNVKSQCPLSWQDFCKIIPKSMSGKVNKLHQAAIKTLGECSSELTDEFLMFIIKLLFNEDTLKKETFMMLNERAKNLTFSDAEDMMNIIVEIRENLNEDVLIRIHNRIQDIEVIKILEHDLFGSNLEYTPATVIWPNTEALHNMSIGNKAQSTDNFTMKYTETAGKQLKTEFDIGTYKNYLKLCHSKFLSMMNMADFERGIITMLKTSENLHNDLLNFLGYEYIENIQYIIQNKINIIDLHSNSKTQKQFNVEMPVISGQVTIQSEKEKQLQKQIRKDEKKLNKITSKRDAKGNLEDTDSEPLEYRLRRQEALIEMNKPIFKKDIVSERNMRQTFPFVFDSNAGRRSTTIYVSNQKVMLPENVMRTDTHVYEKIEIPVLESQPIDVDYKPVKISSLDEIGKLAFRGIESLNRIQSIVFDTAYHTNHNLLICAPTGAGKTNIAMLTVVHQLKQYFSHGQLMKNQFKIIYIAPMKALAAEMTANFSERLKHLNVTVRELTGDMQLTKLEIQQTQMIVTTPEKWDVVTRKGIGDVSLTSIVKLLIIDEVHLLHGDRGPVIEALVARTQRQVESSQSMIRIVGLSATLPNYIDVARFLWVNPNIGLFYFDHRFRPVPLSQAFIGVKASSPMQEMTNMDQVCYDNVIEVLRKGHQVMVFVHARSATVRVAKALEQIAIQKNELNLFIPEGQAKFTNKAFPKSRNTQLIDLLKCGMSVHHAGLVRSERNLVEKYFAQGLIKVLVCTSTLAWGVNLPAHAVIIRGTELYDSKHGSYVDLDILDVLQIFGRAGRPQFNVSGHAVIITSHIKLYHYLSLLTNQIPIESNFITHLADNLNAEIVLGTISNVEEAIKWLKYTYLFVRMKLNYHAYGIPYQSFLEDRNLETRRRELIDSAAKALDKARMIRYNVNTGDLSTTNLGRIASHFYLKYATIEIFNELMESIMSEAQIFDIISKSQEFQQLKVREEEINELTELVENDLILKIQGGIENIHGKVNILLQTHLSHCRLTTFSLISDQAYIIPNATRICRALFHIMLGQNNAIMAGRLLEVSKMFETQQWNYAHPLRKFSFLDHIILNKIESLDLTVDRLKHMSVNEIGNILHDQKSARLVKKCSEEVPALEMEATLQPITRTVLRIRLTIYPQFQWNDRIHGKTSEPFWIWIEDPDFNLIYHHEYFAMTRKMVSGKLQQEHLITIPLREPLPAQYIVRATSDRWLGSESVLPLSFQNLILPQAYPPYTDLLKLQPLPVKALKDPSFEKLYRFSHFNPIQTQIFHCLYHTDNNVLLGAPTGSGKTVVAEIAMLRVFKQNPDQKIVYIAPLKALVRERIRDWKIRFEEKLGKKVVELTGDVSPDIKVIASASVIVTTPEKWDGISRSWQIRSYVKNVALIIIDEIHLLGEERGPVLEVIISRTNFISHHTLKKFRIIGLSTALANAVDLANWLGIKEMGLYNFRPSVRPVPLEIHINGFPGKNYCPRMATMNRPTFQAIRQHAFSSPSLVFVSSRRQTRLTALDLIAYLGADDNPKQWLHMPHEEMDSILDQVRDANLKLTLAFGIGLHHAGLQDRDKTIVEELFVNNKIQVLITTATLAWGVNFPAHLVVIKGTEYYDGKTKTYVDMPITDVLQMMGRAGRPQFDESGVAVVLVHDLKKNFYKKFLHEPFPVESSLLAVLPDHINAEIVAGTIKNKQGFLDYLTWTYFFRRLLKNPRYYNLETLEPHSINQYLSSLVDNTLKVLIESHCIDLDEEQNLVPLSMGKIASFYYLSHETMLIFAQSLQKDLTYEQCLHILCNSHEYNELPVRHNEELLNEELSKICRYAIDDSSYNSPHTKAYLLLQAHISRLPLPCTDYTTDLKSVLDQAIRIIQAMIDTVAEHGWLNSAINIMLLLQMIIQARWIDEPAITTLPHINSEHLQLFKTLKPILPLLCSKLHSKYNSLVEILGKEFQEGQIYQIHQVMKRMPIIEVTLSVGSCIEKGEHKLVSLQPNTSTYIDIDREQDYVLNIEMKRKYKSNNLKAHCPMFQKGKDEGWFLVLGDTSNKELLALKRIPGINEQCKRHQLHFTAPSKIGRTILTFYLISDCYIGLDQQYDVNLNVIP